MAHTSAGAVVRVETREIVVSPDVALRVEIYPGPGETLVMLPGAGLGAASLGDLPERIAAAGYRAVAVNPRGAAGSTGPVDGITLHDLAADVGGLVESLGGRPVHVLGHAGGNRVARCLSADRPELVRTVILVAAGGLVPPDDEAAAALRRLSMGDVPAEERRDLRRLALLAPASDPRLVDRS